MVTIVTLSTVGESMKKAALVLALLSSPALADVARPAGQALTPVYSSASSGFETFVRLWNDSAFASAATVTILDAKTGAQLGVWTTTIPGNASPQFDIADIEKAAVPAITTKPSAYTLYVNMVGVSASSTRMQTVLWSSATGYFQNASGCVQPDVGHEVSNVHTSRLSQYPSTLYIHNDRGVQKSISLTVYDAQTGQSLGTEPFGTVAAFGTAVIPESQIENVFAWTPSASQMHINVTVTLSNTDGTGGLTDFTDIYKVQHVVNNGVDGSVVDMSMHCKGVTYVN